MKIFGRTAGYNLLDHKRNEEILEQMKVEPVQVKLRRNKSNWQRRVSRMNSNGMPKIMLNYRPNGRRRHGRPYKKLLDWTERGRLRPNSGRVMIMMVMIIDLYLEILKDIINILAPEFYI
jgi:hypothetical protein